MSSELKSFVLPKPENKRDFDALDPLDARYYDPEVSSYLSERSRIAYQAYVEAALAQTLADYKVISRKSADAIEKAARTITAEEVYEAEKETRHDIKALVNCIKMHAGLDAAPYVHFGATSYDIIATANALQMRAAIQGLVIPNFRELLMILIDMTEQYADTIQIGRTHGQHAVPITFGFALSEYVSRLGESMLRLELLSKDLKGKFSGAVGAYNATLMFVLDPQEFEKDLLGKVGLEAAPYSTQIVPPEAMVRVIDEMTVTAGILANLAHDMRHLQRSEIAEVRERFVAGQTGSSTMAHKRNPWNFENVISISKQVIAQSLNAKLNLTSEHQRDLTDSASSRFYTIVPASLVAMSGRLRNVMSRLEVDPDNMRHNMSLSQGAIAAEPLYLLFAKYGAQDAHELAKELSQAAIDSRTSLYETVASNQRAMRYWKHFSDDEKEIIRQPESHYIGIAERKAKQLSRKWRKIIGSIGKI